MAETIEIDIDITETEKKIKQLIKVTDKVNAIRVRFFLAILGWTSFFALCWLILLDIVPVDGPFALPLLILFFVIAVFGNTWDRS